MFHSKQIYLLVIIFWLSLVSILSFVIVKSSIQNAEKEFNTKFMNIYHVVSEQAHTNETILEGFAASASVIGKLDRDKIRAYAKQILKRYPHIFMFEIVEKVQHKNLKRFERNFKKNIYSDFKVKAFNYETTRNWTNIDKNTFYMPITFMEPFLDKSKDILGLDLNSNEFLIESLRQSAKMKSPVVTNPFNLIEGDLAYLIQKPVEDHVKRSYRDGVANRYVMLVILAESLFKDTLSSFQDIGVTLYNSKFELDDKKGYLHHLTQKQKTFFEELLFPKLSSSSILSNKTQPFVLSIEKQLGWGILNWWLLSVLIIVAAVSFYVLTRYAKHYHLAEMNRLQEADYLFYLANHDSLTGLANRHLLLDRLRHALNQARRGGTKLAVLFMDLDNFKPVNDTYGHDIGDKLLKSVSERLLACIRRGDTLARRSGDEFILVLESIEDKAHVEMVIGKINDAFDPNFKINHFELNINISIGCAVFPEDGDDEEKLLKIADQRMYKNKR